MLVVIPGRLPGLNEYTKANRSNKYAGAKLKSDTEAYIMLYIPKWATFEKPVNIEFRWYEQGKKRDKDNICFAKKFALDALVKSGVLNGDGWGYVDGFVDKFFIDKESPRVEIRIKEVEL